MIRRWLAYSRAIIAIVAMSWLISPRRSARHITFRRYIIWTDRAPGGYAIVARYFTRAGRDVELARLANASVRWGYRPVFFPGYLR